MGEIVDKLDMGKHALYVWGSFGATALLMIIEPLLLKQRRKTAIATVRRLIRLKEEG